MDADETTTDDDLFDLGFEPLRDDERQAAPLPCLHRVRDRKGREQTVTGGMGWHPPVHRLGTRSR